MQKRNDGIVFIETELCIGCGTCKEMCPYDIPVINEKREKAGKCNLCYDRVEQGQVPFCVQSCPTQARIFGDLNDKNSRLTELIKVRNGYQLKPEANTNPSLYYLND
jgi:Fe-S-cluster-containing dehydrogenase component